MGTPDPSRFAGKAWYRPLSATLRRFTRGWTLRLSLRSSAGKRIIATLQLALQVAGSVWPLPWCWMGLTGRST